MILPNLMALPLRYLRQGKYRSQFMGNRAVAPAHAGGEVNVLD